jgi:phosphoenolpyruvate carboxykinase (GTP)
MGSELPAEGINHSGNWHKDKKDSNGNEITASHKNAR